MRPYIGGPSIGGVPQNLDALSRSATALALHKLDNSGYTYLKERRPDIIVQLEKMSQGWMIIPKAAVASNTHVRDAIANLREWMETGMFPEDLVPIGTSKRLFHDYCWSLADYLEQTVAPALADYRSPHELKEVEQQDGIEPEDESEVGNFDSGDDGEEQDVERLDNSQA